MNVDQVKQRAQRTKPFALQLSNGRRVEVPHPDFVAIGSNIIIVIDENDQVTTIDPHHIVSIEEGSDHGNPLDLPV